MDPNWRMEADQAIRQQHGDGLLAILERAYEKSQLGPKEILLYGIVLMMPPYVDYESAEDVLIRSLQSSERRHAAIWHAYMYTTLSPTNSLFVATIEADPKCEVSAYMMARYHNIEGNYEGSLKWVRRSCDIAMFPHNLVFHLIHDPTLDPLARSRIVSQIEHRVLTKEAENGPPPKDVDALYRDYWEELILGVRMTSENWARISNRIGSIG